MTAIKQQMEVCAYLKCGVVCGGGFWQLVMFLFNYSTHKLYIYILVIDVGDRTSKSH